MDRVARKPSGGRGLVSRDGSRVTPRTAVVLQPARREGKATPARLDPGAAPRQCSSDHVRACRCSDTLIRVTVTSSGLPANGTPRQRRINSGQL